MKDRPEGRDLRRKVRRKLRMLDAVDRVEELRVPPGNQLEKLAGDPAGQWSIRVDRQWRICCRFEEGHARDVKFCDYH
ncbi:MAG: type II toxin-antitoxin system RelE/ParE family toxin [Halofilum sp. (in: g-proteobacteria)]|nr:type II toxin-antitoxin system RelE/ParE family toxin [Halofilum sp. (in: g-proteobacteria)]